MEEDVEEGNGGGHKGRCWRSNLEKDMGRTWRRDMK